MAGAAYAVNKYAKTKGTNSYKLSQDKSKYKLKQPLAHKLIKEGLGYRAPNGRVNNVLDKEGIYYNKNNKLRYDPNASTKIKLPNGRIKYERKFYGRDLPSSTYVENINKNTFAGPQPSYKYKGKVLGIRKKK